jgi:hypothetical protein
MVGIRKIVRDRSKINLTRTSKLGAFSIEVASAVR